MIPSCHLGRINLEYSTGEPKGRKYHVFSFIVRCSDNSKSSKYTKIRRPVKVVYFEKYITMQETMKREHQVKKWTKAKKEALVLTGPLNFFRL